MNIKKTSIGLLLILVFIGMQSMTVDEALNKAVKNNPQIVISEVNTSINNLSVYQAMSSFLPSLTTGLTYTRLDTVPSMQFPNMANPTGPMITIPLGVKDNYSAEITLSMPIFLGGKLVYGYLIAQDNKIKSEIEHHKNISDIKMAVIQMYLSGMLMENMVSLTEQLYKTSQDHLETAQKRYQAGTLSKLELLASQTQVSALKPQVERLKNSRDNLINSLKLFLGMGLDEELVLEGKLDENFIIQSIDNPDPESVDVDVASRKDVQIMKKNVDILKKVNNMSKLAFLPNIVGFTSYSYSNGTGGPDSIQLFNDSLYFSGNLVWGISASLDIFSGGKRVLDVIKTGKQYKQMNMLYSNKLEQTKLEIESAVNNYNIASLNIETYKSGLKTAEEAYRMAKEQYNQGIINNSDYLDAENSFIQAQVNYSQGIYEKNINYYSLLNALGIL